jgi:hypothetical protein
MIRFVIINNLYTCIYIHINQNNIVLFHIYGFNCKYRKILRKNSLFSEKMNSLALKNIV